MLRTVVSVQAPYHPSFPKPFFWWDPEGESGECVADITGWFYDGLPECPEPLQAGPPVFIYSAQHEKTCEEAFPEMSRMDRLKVLAAIQNCHPDTIRRDLGGK